MSLLVAFHILAGTLLLAIGDVRMLLRGGLFGKQRPDPSEVTRHDGLEQATQKCVLLLRRHPRVLPICAAHLAQAFLGAVNNLPGRRFALPDGGCDLPIVGFKHFTQQ